MIVPLILLAVGAFAAGYLNWPDRSHTLADFLGQSPSFQNAYYASTLPNGPDAGLSQNTLRNNFGYNLDLGTGKPAPASEESPFTPVMLVSALIALAGIGAAYFFHLKDRTAGEALPLRFPILSRILENQYWIDEAYQIGIVNPLRLAGETFFAIDQFVVDGVVTVVGFIMPQATSLALKRGLQRGYLQGYALTMLLGVAVIVLIVFW